MSSAFAIAAVTAVLKDLLNDGLIDHDLSSKIGSVKVTATSPDLVSVIKSEDQSQLNLFLYQVTPNSGWRNADLPSRNDSGMRLTNPPLALDLHYLLTAYSAQELHGEVLLGYAMQLLHETPVLSRDAINRTLKPTLPEGVSLPPGLEFLSTSELAEQVEAIKICPQYLSVDEMSKVWSAIQKPYRPTVAYQVSVVLIQGTQPTRSPLPVLTRGRDDRGVRVQPSLIPPYPTIERIDLPRPQISALPGDTLTIVGHHFTQDADGPLAINRMTVRIVHPRLPKPIDVDVPPADYSNVQVKVSLPLGTDQFPAGVYSVSLLMTPADPDLSACTTNEVVLSVAPSIKTIAGQPLSPPPNLLSIPRSNLGDLAPLLLTCNPPVLPGQRVVLLLGARSLPADAITQSSDSLTFAAMGVTAGNYRLRLRVDGVDSLLIDRSDERHPKFDESQQVVIT
jgi:hypothetical protein